MDSRWDLQLKRNLHVAMYLLNPQCFFNKFTTSSLLDVFEKHAHGDLDLLDKLTSEMRIYKDVEFDFGRPAAIRERGKVMSGIISLSYLGEGDSLGRVKSWSILEDSRLGEKYHFGAVGTVRFSLERESLA
ncbi:hypothetical protein Lal_00012225 [Lupinus albus]|nr:hypothetical protein Lal_00012225 [Lupinus albus]